MASEIRALFFDLDNTLLDFVAFKTASTRAALAAMQKEGLKIDKEKAFKQMWRIYDLLGFESRDVFQEFLRQNNHDPRDNKMLAAAVVAYREARAHSLTAYPNVKPVLKALRKKYRLFIVTDAPSLKAWIRLATTGLSDEFERVFAFDDTNQPKRTGAPFRNALEQLGFKPEQAMVIGDSMSKDIVPAKQLGITACLALYGRVKPPRFDRAEPDYTISSIRDLLKICK